MSEYPDEAPAFSSDDEDKKKDGKDKKKGATNAKSKAAKDAPAKSGNKNDHDARFDFPRLPVAAGTSSCDRRGWF